MLDLDRVALVVEVMPATSIEHTGYSSAVSRNHVVVITGEIPKSYCLGDRPILISWHLAYAIRKRSGFWTISSSTSRKIFLAIPPRSGQSKSLRLKVSGNSFQKTKIGFRLLLQVSELYNYHNVVVFVGQNRVQYPTDTMPGSSGSPVFDSDWNVVALHYSGGKLREPGTNGIYYRNEGIHINAVIDGKKAAGL